MKSTGIRLLISCLVVGVLAFFGCGQSTDDDSDTCPAGGVFVTMVDTGYTVGKGAVLSGDPATTPCIPGTELSGDPVARYYNGKIYVINRWQADNIQVINPADNYATVGQYSTGNGTNPQDIAFASSEKAYISMLNSDELLIVNPTNGNRLGTIDLGAYADGDGIPEAAQMVKVQDRLFVALQLLDRNDPWMPPTGPGKIAVIDISSDIAASSIQLSCENPVTDLYYDDTDSRIYIGCVGSYMDASDGGVESIKINDLATNDYTAEGVILTGADLGGNLGALAPASSTSAYAVVSDASFINHLVEFNLRNPAAGVVPVWTASGYVPSIAVDSNGYLYLADQSPDNPGVRVWNTSTNAQVAGPIDIGMLPTDFAVMK